MNTQSTQRSPYEADNTTAWRKDWLCAQSRESQLGWIVTVVYCAVALGGAMLAFYSLNHSILAQLANVIGGFGR